MPPTAIRTIRQQIYWQYAKIIAESSGIGRKSYGFVMDRFKKLDSGEIEWSTSIREWVHERETPRQCIYCGATENITTDHLIPLSRGGPDHPDNAIWSCMPCNAKKGSKRLYEFYGLENRNKIPRLAEGKYLKLIYTELEKRGVLDTEVSHIADLCARCDLGKLCPEKEKLTVYCLEGIFTKP
ncbi:MAG: HNH endonuclease [Candidatus Bathyarchaeota archaeon]|nr:HNH endonuclease [Candidatus Bathyarchaeota archaeon]